MNNEILEKIRRVLQEDERVLFAYLYGSILSKQNPRDIDIAIFGQEGIEPHKLSADLKIALYQETGIAPDVFDVHLINTLIEEGDLFALLFMKKLFINNLLLVDRSPQTRTDYIERYSLKYRECEGLIDEVLR